MATSAHHCHGNPFEFQHSLQIALSIAPFLLIVPFPLQPAITIIYAILVILRLLAASFTLLATLT